MEGAEDGEVAMSYKNIILDRSERVAKITLNRPKALNALNSELIAELNAALDVLENDDAVAVIVDAARQANLGATHYGMAGFDPTNVNLVDVIDDSRRRAAPVTEGSGITAFGSDEDDCNEHRGLKMA